MSSPRPRLGSSGRRLSQLGSLGRLVLHKVLDCETDRQSMHNSGYTGGSRRDLWEHTTPPDSQHTLLGGTPRDHGLLLISTRFTSDGAHFFGRYAPRFRLLPATLARGGRG